MLLRLSRPFFLSWVANTQLYQWTKWVVNTQLITSLSFIHHIGSRRQVRRQKTKLCIARFFETALRAIVINQWINELIRISSGPNILRSFFFHCLPTVRVPLLIYNTLATVLVNMSTRTLHVKTNEGFDRKVYNSKERQEGNQTCELCWCEGIKIQTWSGEGLRANRASSKATKLFLRK